MPRLLLLFFVYVWLGNAHASEPDTGSHLVELGERKIAVDSREERLELAQELRNKIEESRSVIPNPSPEARRWVEEEGDEIRKTQNFSVERVLEWRGSREFNHVLMRDVHTAMSNWIDCIFNSDRLSKEIWCWSGLAATLLNDDLRERWNVLVQHRVIPENSGGWVLFYNRWGREILINVVNPYLQALDQQAAR